MQKEWQGNKVDIYTEDGRNGKIIRKRFAGAIRNVTEEQVSAFTQAIDSLNDFPVSHAVLIEEHRFTY